MPDILSERLVRMEWELEQFSASYRAVLVAIADIRKELATANEQVNTYREQREKWFDTIERQERKAGLK
jgi:hypothetical protein